MGDIIVIDYGMGNLHSVSKAIEHVTDAQVCVSADPDAIMKADRVVFPGVGAIRDCISELQQHELTDVVLECARSKPFLGVCLGMQALFDYSEENDGTACLGIIPGQVRRFADDMPDPDSGRRLKIPHMGWNTVHQAKAHPLWQDIAVDTWFYFVHSYYAAPASQADVAGVTAYGVPFCSVVARDNIFAVQFHPEKSQQGGLALLANFVRWDGGV